MDKTPIKLLVTNLETHALRSPWQQEQRQLVTTNLHPVRRDRGRQRWQRSAQHCSTSWRGPSNLQNMNKPRYVQQVAWCVEQCDRHFTNSCWHCAKQSAAFPDGNEVNGLFFFFRTKVYWVWFVVTAGKCIEQLWRVPPHKLDVNLLPTATLSEADKAGAIFHSTTRIKPYRCTTSKSTVRYTTTEQAIFEYAIIGSYVLFHFAESPTHFNCFDEHEGRIRSNTLDDM